MGTGLARSGEGWLQHFSSFGSVAYSGRAGMCKSTELSSSSGLLAGSPIRKLRRTESGRVEARRGENGDESLLRTGSIPRFLDEAGWKTLYGGVH
jgi:hypothetical protein